MYAIIEDGSRQYQVHEGDRIEIDYRDVPIGQRIEFTRVLLYSGQDGTLVGSPVVENAKVVAEVVAQVKGEKIYVQKFRRREKYRRRIGHRQRYTQVLVREILIGSGRPVQEAAPGASQPPEVGPAPEASGEQCSVPEPESPEPAGAEQQTAEPEAHTAELSDTGRTEATGLDAGEPEVPKQ